MNVLIIKKVFSCDFEEIEVLIIFDEYVNMSLVGFIIVFYKYKEDLDVGDVGIICFFGVGYFVGNVIV